MFCPDLLHQHHTVSKYKEDQHQQQDGIVYGWKQWWGNFSSSFDCYLATPWPTLGHYRGGSLTHLMLITCVLHIWPKGHQEPCNKIESLSLVEHLVGFELGTFQFWSQCLNSLGHSPPLKREVIGNISNFSSASEPSRVFSNSVIGYQKKTMNTNWEEFCKALLNIFGATCQSITYELVVSTINK